MFFYMSVNYHDSKLFTQARIFLFVSWSSSVSIALGAFCLYIIFNSIEGVIKRRHRNILLCMERQKNRFAFARRFSYHCIFGESLKLWKNPLSKTQHGLEFATLARIQRCCVSSLRFIISNVPHIMLYMFQQNQH